MEVSREQILRRMTVLKIKVEERLKLCHGDRVTPQVYATFRKDILEYIHEMEVCITKLELSQTPETDVLDTEVSWASQLMEYHIELGCPRGVMVKAMNCGIVVREFVLQSRYYVHFRANTLGKGMNPLILPPAMGK